MKKRRTRAETTRDPVDQARVEDEVGDVLFVAVNLAAGLSIRKPLSWPVIQNESRFRYIEEQAEKYGKDIEDLSLDDMESLWQEAKTKSSKAG